MDHGQGASSNFLIMPFLNIAIDYESIIRHCQKHSNYCSLRLPMDQAPRKKTLKELRNEAIAQLERRGYDVRGKTPAQIRIMLRTRPSKRLRTDFHSIKASVSE